MRDRDPSPPDLRPRGATRDRPWEALPTNPRPQSLCGRPRPRMRHHRAHDSMFGKQTLWAATACPRHWPPSVQGA
jgi:hypothetical protein